MAYDALNFFSPFRRLEPNHENQLTRALLVVLRVSPISHAAWLRYVAPSRALHELPTATFDTQSRTLRRKRDTDEQAELISVFLTPEGPLASGSVVTESDRGQVLDAVIDYGELVVVVENKVGEASDRQAREINVTGANVWIAQDRKQDIKASVCLPEGSTGPRDCNQSKVVPELIKEIFRREYFP